VCLGLQLAGAAEPAKTSWSDELLTPVANPIFFESPDIGSELRPIYVYHRLNDKFLPGDVQLMALQFRLALTERLALIATKDGYMTIRPDAGGDLEGWADIGGGLKYALIDDQESKFILTPGVKFELPTGDSDVFQGNGDGEFDLFVSAAKGFEKLQLMGTLGVRLPLDDDEETSQMHYSLQLAYANCQWFKPFVALNGYTVLSEGTGPAIGSEGYDVINFGTSNAGGETQIVLGAGFRSSLSKSLDLGVAYEKDVTHDDGIFDDRLTVDVIWKF
jgi:hypothetical protein